MYKIIKDGAVIASQPALCWLKKQDNGVFVHAAETDGQAILVDDTIYIVRGRAEAEGRDVVDIVRVQESTAGGGGDDRLDSVEAQLNAITEAVERGMQ